MAPQVAARVAAHAASPAALPSATRSGPVTELRVFHGTTAQHVAGLELRLVSRSVAGASRGLPGEAPPFHLLGENHDSPVRLIPEFTAASESNRVRLTAIRVESPIHSERIELDGNGPVVHRGFALYARAHGTAWGRLELDLREAAARELTLRAGADLSLTFSNWQPAAYVKLGLRPRLTLSAAGESAGTPLAEQQLPAIPDAPRLLLRGVPADQRLEVLVDLGTRFEREQPPRLADQWVDRAPAAHAGPVVIVLADPPVPIPTARLALWLTLPEFPGRDDVELRLFGEGSTYIEPSATLRLDDLNPAGIDAWNTEVDVPVGVVQAKLWPLLTSWRIDVPSAGTRADLTVREIAEVQVAILDRRTGRPAEVNELYFRREEGFAGMHNYVGRSVRGAAPTNRFVLHTTPGKIELEVDQDDPRRLGVLSLAVRGGRQDVDLVVGGSTGISVRFRIGDSLLPIAAPGLPGLYLHAVEHDGHQTLDRTQIDGGIQVSAPGRYRLSLDFRGDSPYRYTGDELILDVVPDRSLPLEIALARR